MTRFLLLGLLMLGACAEIPCGDVEPDTACKFITGALSVGFSLLTGGQ